MAQGLNQCAHPRRPAVRILSGLALAGLGLAGCGTLSRPAWQTVQVQVESDDPDWRGPLDCEARNAAGRWTFAAPGSVTLQVGRDALHLSCRVSAAGQVEAVDAAPKAASSAQVAARRGAAIGARVGTGAGLVLGVAAAPVAGPALALLLAVGSAVRGAEIGGAVAAVTASDRPAYPSPITLHLRRAPVEAGAQGTP